MADDKNKQIATQVVEAVGGKENISSALHCMTRLRLTLKDEGLADLDTIKAIKGVLGAQWSGSQLQVIIGQNVGKVHDAVVAMGVASGGTVDENLDGDLAGQKQPLTAKGVGQAILGYLSGAMVPMIPLLMTAGLMKTIGVIVGPAMLGLVPAESSLVVLMDFVYNAGFYFLPIYLGWTAAQKLGVTPILGAYIGGILIAPAFVQMATDGTPFDVFGIPCAPANYSSTVLPILLSVWVMSYVEKFFKKHLPDVLTTVFSPFLTMLVMLPVSLGALAPLGNMLGVLIGNALFAMGSAGGILSILGGGLLCALWLPMVTTGMHVAVIMLAIGTFMTTGVDNFVLVCTTIGLWTGYGAEFAAFLKLKDPEDKSLALGYFISNTVGGVGEPFIYGILFQHPRLWVTNSIAAFVTGALSVALGLQVYNMAASSVLNLLAFVGPDPSNLTKTCICAAVGFVLGLVLAYLFGFTKEELEPKEA